MTITHWSVPRSHNRSELSNTILLLSMKCKNRDNQYLRTVVKTIYTWRVVWLKVIYKGSFKSFVALCADRICSDQHFVENCIEKFPSV